MYGQPERSMAQVGQGYGGIIILRQEIIATFCGHSSKYSLLEVKVFNDF